ncbi:MAG: hypothetical protein IPO21_17635 [Bacteroidales bacterium]|nr:hypothetical protein [Bacteroidales bacterium]
MKVILFVMIVLLSFASCNTSKKNTIEAQKIDMKFVRFDSIIHSWKGIDKDTFELKVTEQIKAHGDFIEAFNTGIIKVGSAYNAMYYDNLHEFLNYPIYDEINVAIQQKLSNLEAEKHNMQLAFGRLKTLYPKNTTPAVYFFNGVFNQSIVIIENGIGVRIDKYLGADCLYYKQMDMQQFQIKKMYKEKIPTDVLIGYLQTEFENNFADANLLANMIHSGRIMYLTQMLMPETADTVLWGYTAKQF